ncbi:MAG: hypothetical protein JWM02_227 [Frankiales bacterium]|nr:hypothetical protein [Frankiales bacterium]
MTPDEPNVPAVALSIVHARLIALGLAALYAVALPVHLTQLTGVARTVMASLAAASIAGMLAWAAVASRWPQRVTPPRSDALAVVPLVNSLAHLALTADIRQTTTLMLVFLAVGAAAASCRFAVAICVTATIAWAIICASFAGPARKGLLHYAVQLGMALTLAALLFAMRRRRENHLLAVQTQLIEHVGRVEAGQQELALSEHRFRSLFRDSPVGIGLSDEHGLFVAANRALCRLLGRDEAEILGHSGNEFTHPEDVPSQDLTRAWLANPDPGIVRTEKRYVRPSGEVRWVWLTVNKVDGPTGQRWSIGHMLDVSERKATEQALTDSEGNLAAVSAVVRRIRTGEDARHAITTAALEMSGANSCCILEPRTPDGLIVTGSAGVDLIGTTIAFDSVSVSLAVYRSGKPLFLSDAAGDPRVSQVLLQAIEGTALLLQPVIADGVVTGVLSVSWPYRVESVSDRAVRAIELLADEAAIALQHDQLLTRLAALASTDTLTGLDNRRGWDDRLGQLLAQSRRTGAPVTVAILDLDHFKKFNDQHGHLRGDAMLSTTARKFQAQLREVDLLARWGGEEFAVALPGCDSAAARPLLERLRPAVTHGQTCSVGYATWDGVETPEQLLARADEALYDAKAAGRNRSVAALTPAPRRPPVEETAVADGPR